MTSDPYRDSLIRRALQFDCFLVQPRPQGQEWDLEGGPVYRQLPYALCYKPEPGEATTGIRNELFALDRPMTVADALGTLSTLEIEHMLDSRTSGLTLLSDNITFAKIRVFAVHEPEDDALYLTQAIGEFPVSWWWDGPPVERWKPLDERVKFPKQSNLPLDDDGETAEPAAGRFDALEFLTEEQAPPPPQPDGVQRRLTHTSIPEGAVPAKAVPEALAAAVIEFYGDMSRARAWPPRKR